jgi:hypothetical protein
MTSSESPVPEQVAAHFPSNRLDKTRIVTELFPSDEVENVQKLFPSHRKYGESNGEMKIRMKIRDHSIQHRATSNTQPAPL